MEAKLNAFLEDSSARYVAAKNEGQRVICGRWRVLARETRTALVDSGFYTLRGERRVPEGVETTLPKHDAERLEEALGLFKLCMAAKLPLATEKHQSIPREAYTEEVMSAAGELLFVRDWQDPEFLRLALGAVAKHEQANALSMHTAPRILGPAWGCMGAMLKAALFIAMPGALAVGLVASAGQDVGVGALAFYLVALGVLAILSTAGIGTKKDGFELAYGSWSRFQLNGAVGVTGAGSLEQLRRMAKDGVNVPSIAFDLAHMLRCRTQGAVRTESVPV